MPPPDPDNNDSTRSHNQAPDPLRTVSLPGDAAITMASATGEAAGRFVFGALHARGGLGEVYAARDTELNREVALKRIQAQFADDPNSRRRFLTEAEITAHLDHPGIVPVFGLVADGLGRPCYAMRFIRGQSLKDEIGRYHSFQLSAGSSEKPVDPAIATASLPSGATVAYDPADDPPSNAPRAPKAAPGRTSADRLAFRQLLQRFVAVCQAIGYSHSRGVIHRDIKPANIMVGAFGETLVVDWGLARVLGSSGAGDEAGHASASPTSDSGDGRTAAGSVIGTPGYMSPEQAAGRIDELGPRSDVYSLGATLYTLLTGRPPLERGSIIELLERIQRGAFPRPREVNATVPKALEAVCQKAMALRQEDRYGSALEVAADVERWLSDEPVSCYRDPLSARLARWTRRNPARVAGTASVLVTGAIALVVVAGVYEEKRKSDAALIRETDAKTKVADALVQVTDAEKRTNAALVQVTDEKQRTEQQRQAASSARDLARTRFAIARLGFETIVLSAQVRLADRAGTQDIRRELLLTARAGIQKLLDTVADTPGADRQDADQVLFWTSMQLGELDSSLGNTTAALKGFQTAVEAGERLFRGQPGSVQAKHDIATAYDRLAGMLLQAGRSTEAIRAGEAALGFRAAILLADSDNEAAQRAMAASNDRLASIQMARGNLKDANALCAASLGLRLKLYQSHPKDAGIMRELAQTYARFAEIQLSTGQLVNAEKSAQLCLFLREEVVKAKPGIVEYQRELAAAQTLLGEHRFARGDLPGALNAYRASARLLDESISQDPFHSGIKSDAATIHGRIGVVLLRAGGIPAAITETSKGQQLALDAVKADPGSADAERVLARSQQYLGDALLADGKRKDAMLAYFESVSHFGHLRNADPNNIAARVDLAGALTRYGDAQHAVGDAANAIATLEQARDLREELIQSDRATTGPRRELAASLDRLCAAQLSLDNPLKANIAAIRAFNLCRELSDANPNSAVARRDLGLAYLRWAEATDARGHNTAALMMCHKAIAEFDRLIVLDKTNYQAMEDKAMVLDRMAEMYAMRGQIDAQVELVLKAADVRATIPETPVSRLKLVASKRRVGDALLSQGFVEKARANFTAAREMATKADNPAVFGPELARVSDSLTLCDAVEEGLKDPVIMRIKYPPQVANRALIVLNFAYLRKHDHFHSSVVLGQLIERDDGPETLYQASRGFALLAGQTPPGKVRDSYLKDAVFILHMAQLRGFRDADRVEADVAWTTVRQLAGEILDAELKAIRKAKPIAPAPRVKSK